MEEKNRPLRLIPIFCLLILLASMWYMDLFKYLKFDYLQAQYKQLFLWVEAYPILSIFAYFIIYVLVCTFSIPGASYLTLMGGVLFPQPYSTIVTILAATIGASLVFLLAEYTFSAFSNLHNSKAIKKMEMGFKEHTSSYLLFLRLVPIFPFFLVNLAGAFFRVPFKIYFLSTLIGIAPGTFAYCQLGVGLKILLEQGLDIEIQSLFSNEMKLALLILGVLSLSPAIYSRLKK